MEEKRKEDNHADEREKEYRRNLNIWRGLTLALAIALIGAGGYGYRIYTQRNEYKTFLQNQYQRSFRDLVTDVENLKILLDKAEVTGSNVQSNVLMNQIWKNGYSASESLGQLPISQGILFPIVR